MAAWTHSIQACQISLHAAKGTNYGPQMAQGWCPAEVVLEWGYLSIGSKRRQCLK